MNIFGIGLPEIAVIAAIALFIFGPKKLPALGRGLGKTLRSLQKASSEFENELQKAVSASDKTDQGNQHELKHKENSPQQNKKYN
ncbi:MULTISPECIES: TatA/E family twin arginine-targeting protein translocase [Prochlorococcus]|uniref:Sec-independent protein translocase protein TatA n=1 Tax=Prochlorococcus marinus (strain SARG / CCMP1375 / SS120) TaxID=167539 RepID=Q7VDT6_PROMA|nr:MULTISPECIES: TatA/E family twin arginine-targeting protein translocase [Prochlorococcus]AAP99328.1 Sec-independent protein secretion pathway component TatA [Prochlorococcus marinus subsp. marinus str. CCMP1375]KGG11400.1 Twin-arginine translocation protein TatA [Prochlorococcus marinus str. LG]KGG18644.1 Twin-arginine translocation protein TatA [Prochlorococcus marinus str. SS2]KGG22917.1 Twin-arginine translocation protein TatA [Prochlorococcus marinus str. SS35]KGG34021.1 Twin-arginine t